MPEQTPVSSDSSPRVGMILVHEGMDWTLAGRSTYKNPDAWQITEWECEAGGRSGSLLKEIDPSGRITWFFTTEIPASAVRLPDGKGLIQAKAASPPEALVYEGETYRYAETTEGTHEDDSGESQRKTTWDYWDARHQFNLAIELWADGSLECYRGQYILPGQFTFRQGRSRPAARRGTPLRLGGHPLRLALVVLPFAYLVSFFTNHPIDVSLTFALAAALTAGWLSALRHAPLAALAALLAGAVAAAVFWRFPPLTTWPGAALFFATPLAVRLLVYFRFAPGPHTPDQFALALGPAGIAGLIAWVVSGLLLSREAK